jgi:RNA polymerase-binding transcription factor DksA
MVQYSDIELEEFKANLLQKIELAKNELFHLENRDHPIVDQITKKEFNRLLERQQRFISSLNDALKRIENKTYGICRATGNLISKERLMAVPHATLSKPEYLK